MSKKTKRMTALILSAMMMFSAAATGCSKDEKEESKESSSASSSTSSSASSGESSEAKEDMVGNMYRTGLPIVKEPMTFTAVVGRQPVDKVASNDKPLLKQFEEETNVHIEWTDILNSAWAEKFNILMASKDYPDMVVPGFCGYDITKFYRAFTPLNDLIEEYAPTFSQFYVDHPEVPQAIKLPDGETYAFPSGFFSGDAPSGTLWLNKVWLDKVGMDMPETMEDLHQVLIAFRDKDPNGNGKKDEIPFLYEGTGAFNCFYSALGIPDVHNHIQVRDGKCSFIQQKDEFYEAMKYIHMLQEEGLLDPEGLTHNHEQFCSKAHDVLGGVAPARSIGVHASDAVEQEYYVPFLVKGPNGEEPVIGGCNPTTFGPDGVAITIACKTPEVLVRWFDYLNSDQTRNLALQQGPANVTYEIVDNNPGTFAWQRFPVDKLNENLKKAGFENYGNYRFSAGHVYLGADLYNVFGTSVVNPEANKGQLRLGEFESTQMGPRMEKEYIPNALWKPEMQQERATLSVDIDNYLEQFVAKCVREGIDDKGWEAHLKQLEKLQVERYVELFQEFYDGLELKGGKWDTEVQH